VDEYLGYEAAPWDFNSFRPHLIVVNLGTNDKDYTRGVPERTAAFQAGYEDFLREVRRLNPDSFIICALGVMGQELCPQVEAAAASLGKTDSRICSMRFDVQLKSDGIGAEDHPNLVTHRKMADALVREIEKHGDIWM
jgi:hypothetical protein